MWGVSFPIHLLAKETEMEKPKLEKARFTFTQDGNCNGTTEDMEVIHIECDSSLGVDSDKGCFYVLKTETGWSIDGLDDLKDLIERCNKSVLSFEKEVV